MVQAWIFTSETMAEMISEPTGSKSQGSRDGRVMRRMARCLRPRRSWTRLLRLVPAAEAHVAGVCAAEVFTSKAPAAGALVAEESFRPRSGHLSSRGRDILLGRILVLALVSGLLLAEALDLIPTAETISIPTCCQGWDRYLEGSTLRGLHGQNDLRPKRNRAKVDPKQRCRGRDDGGRVTRGCGARD